jgi:hypothetical protein
MTGLLALAGLENSRVLPRNTRVVYLHLEPS